MELICGKNKMKNSGNRFRIGCCFSLPSPLCFTLAKQLEMVTAKLSNFGTNELLYLINIGAVKVSHFFIFS